MEGLGTFSWFVLGDAALDRLLLAKNPGKKTVGLCCCLSISEVEDDGREGEEDWKLERGDRTCSAGAASRGDEISNFGGLLEEDFLLDLLVVLVIVLVLVLGESPDSKSFIVLNAVATEGETRRKAPWAVGCSASLREQTATAAKA